MLLFCLFAVLVSVQCAPQVLSEVGTEVENATISTEKITEGTISDETVTTEDSTDNIPVVDFAHFLYAIHPNFSENARETIRKSFSNLQNLTCLWFEETKYSLVSSTNDPIQVGDDDLILFRPSKQCFAVNLRNETVLTSIYLNEESCFNETGRINDMLTFALNLDCTPKKKGDAIFLWENFGNDNELRLREQKEAEVTVLGSSYDPQKVVHLYHDDNSADGEDSDQPLQENVGFNLRDVISINEQYCPLTTSIRPYTSPTSDPNGGPDTTIVPS